MYRYLVITLFSFAFISGCGGTSEESIQKWGKQNNLNKLITYVNNNCPIKDPNAKKFSKNEKLVRCAINEIVTMNTSASAKYLGSLLLRPDNEKPLYIDQAIFNSLQANDIRLPQLIQVMYIENNHLNNQKKSYIRTLNRDILREPNSTAFYFIADSLGRFDDLILGAISYEITNGIVTCAYYLGIQASSLNKNIKDSLKYGIINNSRCLFTVSSCLGDSNFIDLINHDSEKKNQCIGNLLDYCSSSGDKQYSHWDLLLDLATTATNRKCSKQEIVLAFVLKNSCSSTNDYMPSSLQEIVNLNYKLDKLEVYSLGQQEGVSELKSICGELARRAELKLSWEKESGPQGSENDRSKAYDEYVNATREYNKFNSSLPPGLPTTSEQNRQLELLKKAADAEWHMKYLNGKGSYIGPDIYKRDLDQLCRRLKRFQKIEYLETIFSSRTN